METGGISAILTLQSSMNVTVANKIILVRSILGICDLRQKPVHHLVMMTAAGDGDEVDRHPAALLQGAKAIEPGAGLAPAHQTQGAATRTWPEGARDWGARGEACTKYFVHFFM